MSRRWPQSLLWRLGLVLIGTQLVVALALGWYAYDRLESFHLGHTRAELARVTSLLSARYTESLVGMTGPELDRMMKQVGRDLDVRITIILEDGTVIADSDASPAEMELHGYRPEILAAREEGTGTATRYSRTVGATLLYYASRAEPADEHSPVVRTAMPLSQLGASLAELTRAVGIAAGISILITLSIFLLISRRHARQVRRLADGAGRFASGELGHHIQPPVTSELGELADSLNKMGEQLQRRIGELESRRREERAILQSMSNAVIALDPDQRILNLNAAARNMLHLDASEHRGKLLQETIRQPELHRFIEAAIELAGEQEGEFTLHGDPVAIVQARSEVLTDEEGRPSGVVVVLNDVTQLRRLEVMRSDFAANVSHELRTPITNIQGYVETLLETGFDDADQTRLFLEIVRKNSRRLASIIEDVMTLTRVDQTSAEDAIERETLPVESLVRGVCSQSAALAREKRIDVRVDVPDDMAASVHSHLLEQAVGNLLSNAINYSPEGSTVHVEARRIDGGGVQISVRDDGPGIAPQHLDRLFERFYRVDKARSREAGGTGLGLALVKHIALAHGGSVEVQSTVGEGSTFTLRIPDEAGNPTST